MDTRFKQRVLAVVRNIPVGRVATYGDIATLAGKPRAARAVGNIMKDCGRADVPCHRVIAAGGRLGGYGGNEMLKRALLVAEGVPVHGSRVRLQACRITIPARKARPERLDVARASPSGVERERAQPVEEEKARKVRRNNARTRRAPR